MRSDYVIDYVILQVPVHYVTAHAAAHRMMQLLVIPHVTND